MLCISSFQKKMNFGTIIILIVVILPLFFSCSKLETGTVTDIDGNVYRTVKIGKQVWMAENLKVTRYRNGDQIPNVTDCDEWRDLATDAYCIYENDERNLSTYGRLYNWFAVNDSRNIAPEGWHVPTNEEWQILVNYLGGDDIAGGSLKESGTVHWQSPNEGATNESGFSALPGCGRFSYGGNDFVNLGRYAIYWSSSKRNPISAWMWRLDYNCLCITNDIEYKRDGYSVRFIRD